MIMLSLLQADLYSQMWFSQRKYTLADDMAPWYTVVVDASFHFLNAKYDTGRIKWQFTHYD